MEDKNILELTRMTLEGIQFLAQSYGIDTHGKNKQLLAYEILDAQTKTPD
ncbi:MAG: hypothetical protein JZU65_06170 [Chlorobium sp.]|nr:hypothetical protein [Chlorobium sp.]